MNDEEYKELLKRYPKNWESDIRTELVQRKREVQHIIALAGCMKSVTVGPPPAVGGFIIRDANPFDLIFDEVHGYGTRQVVREMIDETIGAIHSGALRRQPRNEAVSVSRINRNYAFIAMAMDRNDKGLDDVYDAIRDTAQALSITAERVDEQQRHERITDRIIESIDRAEFVICDLTHARPNVYFEAGYAHGRGKVPIYIAREGTEIHFDIKDYPVIFFGSVRELKKELNERLKGLAKRAHALSADRPVV